MRFGPTFARATLSGPTLGRDQMATDLRPPVRSSVCFEIAYASSGRYAAPGAGGAGVYHLRVQGSALAPYSGGSPQPGRRSSMRDRRRPNGEHAAIAVDAHALSHSQAFVDLTDGVRRYSGRPIAFVTLGVWAGFEAMQAHQRGRRRADLNLVPRRVRLLVCTSRSRCRRAADAVPEVDAWVRGQAPVASSTTRPACAELDERVERGVAYVLADVEVARRIRAVEKII